MRVAKITTRSVPGRASAAFGSATPALATTPLQTVIICTAAPYSSRSCPLRYAPRTPISHGPRSRRSSPPPSVAARSSRTSPYR